MRVLHGLEIIPIILSAVFDTETTIQLQEMYFIQNQGILDLYMAEWKM